MWSCQSWQVQNPSIEPNSLLDFWSQGNYITRILFVMGKCSLYPFRPSMSIFQKASSGIFFLRRHFLILQKPNAHVWKQNSSVQFRHTDIIQWVILLEILHGINVHNTVCGEWFQKCTFELKACICFNCTWFWLCPTTVVTKACSSDTCLKHHRPEMAMKVWGCRMKINVLDKGLRS